MRSASTRAWVTARRGKSMKRAYGDVDDRLRRPAPLPPLPEQARKAGKCSPSPTYPQAPSTTTIASNDSRNWMSLHNDVHIKPVDTKSPIHVRGLKAHGRREPAHRGEGTV